MVKSAKWIRKLLGLKKTPKQSSPSSEEHGVTEKPTASAPNSKGKRFSFGKRSSKDNVLSHGGSNTNLAESKTLGKKSNHNLGGDGNNFNPNLELTARKSSTSNSRRSSISNPGRSSVSHPSHGALTESRNSVSNYNYNLAGNNNLEASPKRNNLCSIGSPVHAEEVPMPSSATPRRNSQVVYAEEVHMPSSATPKRNSQVGPFGPSQIEEPAAIKIQTAYRGHLARKARRALKCLIRVQALVRGYLARKRVQYMRAMLYVHALRSLRESATSGPHSSTHYRRIEPINGKLNDMDDNWSAVEMDHVRPRSSSRRTSGAVSASSNMNPTISSTAESRYYRRPKQNPLPRLSIPERSTEASATQDVSSRTGNGEEYYLSTSRENPKACSSVSSRRGSSGLLTPTRGEHAESVYGNGRTVTSCPNYMANTESSRAKVRSQSVPRQRASSLSDGSTATRGRRATMQGEAANAMWLRSPSQVPSTQNGYHHVDRSSIYVEHEDIDTVSMRSGMF